MATILEMKKRFEAIDTDAISLKAVEESTEQMANLNAEQINTGVKADGTEMPDYSLRSVVQYGKPYGPIRLRDTGAWQAGIYVRASGDAVTFSSTDNKNSMLEERYGEDILGLSEKYKSEAIREAVQPAFSKLIEQATGLKMK